MGSTPARHTTPKTPQNKAKTPYIPDFSDLPPISSPAPINAHFGRLTRPKCQKMSTHPPADSRRPSRRMPCRIVWPTSPPSPSPGAVESVAPVPAIERDDALKYALGANAIHGQRRSPADKRRCVELALKEFPGLTNEVIADMCAVDPKTVASVSGSSGISRPEKLIGKDGRQYPASRRTSNPTTPARIAPESFAPSAPSPPLAKLPARAHEKPRRLW